MLFFIELLWSWCLFTAIENLTNTKVCSRVWGISVIGQTMLLFGRMWNTSVPWTRTVVQCFKHGLMGTTSWGIEDSSAEGDVNCGGPAQEVSEEKSSKYYVA